MNDSSKETIEERAKEFVEENKDLVEDPETSVNVLGRVIVQGAPIATSYQDDIIEPFTDTYELACRELEDAWGDESVTPKGFKEIESRFNVLEAEKAKILKGFDFFKDFMDEAHRAYSAKLDEDQLTTLEEFGVSEEWLENTPEVAATERPTPRSRSGWRRWFGG